MSNENFHSNRPRQSRFLDILLYFDNSYHQEVYSALLSDENFVGAIHDQDVDEDGNLKKKHLHGIYRFNSPTTKGSFLKLFPNFEENLINCVKNIRSCARYLLHSDSPDKFSYDENALVGNVSFIRRYLVDKYDIDDLFYDIFDFIVDNNITNLKEVIQYCRIQGSLQAFRLYQYTIRDLVKSNKE